MIGYRYYFIPCLFSSILHLTLIVISGSIWQISPEDSLKKTPSYVKAKILTLQTTGNSAVDKKIDPKRAAQIIKRYKAATLKRQKAAELALKNKSQNASATQEKNTKPYERNDAQRWGTGREAQSPASNTGKSAWPNENSDWEDTFMRWEAEEAMSVAVQEEEDFIAALSDQVLIDSARAIIDEAIQRNWSRPASARNYMVVELRIYLVPTGRVINVEVIESSGDEAFDRSAVIAVQKTQQFPELMHLPVRIFDGYFRKLKLIFRPEDLKR